jgi:hypothetical protein
MYIKCDKCNGRVVSDRVFFSDTHVELYCFSCGKRWIFNHPENRGAFALWIWRTEKEHLKKSRVG